ncbi:MAG: ribose-phosphate diphosphokinase [Candidatus Micrarchaeia archaeon]
MMTKKLIVCATPSGEKLGEKVCSELTKIARREFERYKDADANSIERQVSTIISHLFQYNSKVFKRDDFSLWPVEANYFKSGEMKPVIKESVRGAEVFLIHCSYVPRTPLETKVKMLEAAATSEERMALLKAFENEKTVLENDHIAEFYIDALKVDGGADRVCLISPFYGNARQDHRRTREGLTARTQITLFEAVGADSFFFVDLHSQSIVGFTRKHADNVYPTSELVDEFKRQFPEYMNNFVMIPPDAGAFKRSEHISKKYTHLRLSPALKVRDYSTSNKVDMIIVTEPSLVAGKNVVIFEDIVDTAGTVTKLITELCEKYHCRGVVVVAPHLLLSDKGLENIDLVYDKGYLLKLITTDSVPRPPGFENEHKWYSQISMAPKLASIIYNMYMKQGIGDVHMQD